ncbi:MAG: 30S ribosomal protein S3 [Mycoplasma sp.]|nr:30S ribosomal protein S3 [Mycoplasma sp.]
MGQKVNPNGLRIGINKNWESRWVAKDNYQTAQWLVEDDKIRKHIFKFCKPAQVASVEIERQQNAIDLFIHCSQPGIILGKEMANLKVLKKQINLIVGRKVKVSINVLQIEKSALSARIVAREIADAIENRISFRNAQKLAIKKVLMAGAKGIKTHVSGRLGGVEMAREEGYSEGVVPLTTLRADIDYAVEEALTTYGLIGVKVWINRGEVFNKDFVSPTTNKPQFKRNNENNLKDKRQPKPQFVKKEEKSSQESVVDPEALKREQEQLKAVEVSPEDKQETKETSIIMISTTPEHADIILNDGRKNVFFYKVTPINEVKRVLIYATAPKKAVVGEFDLEKIHIVAPSTAWQQHGSASCFSKKEFDEYFEGYEKAHTLIASKTFKYKNPKTLDQFNMKKGPSGFQYLK